MPSAKIKKMWCLLCLQQHQAEIWEGVERCLRGFRNAKAKNKPFFSTNKPCVSSEPVRSSEEMNLKDIESLNQ